MGRIPYELTGISFPLFGASWQKKRTDKAVANSVIRVLEDRRLLFGDRHAEDEMHCVESALEIRQYLTTRLTDDEMGNDLRGVLKAMRAACRKFVEVAGPNACNFMHRGSWGPSGDVFGLALGDLRSQMGFYIAALVIQYKIEIEDDLAKILPPPPVEDNDDLLWIPGFD
ncbi:DUF6650 family protein [Actinopolymorpha pittospori]|uniref:Uncharacterized protein n=1 Tax=Actinopolymorpha pittospori TaxID=648752 RepID=A0A927R5V5_9ACTN|nr:DUF6650 family protein [Actinopolymorpha pittospori]MBE1603737.1 hypothetical protein [Actinopolymorpha pittospori]